MTDTTLEYAHGDAKPQRALFWSAAVTSLLALLAFSVAATTPPRTGPFAAPGSSLPYPYEAAVQFVPRDFVWMYGVLLMVLAYLFMCVCVHRSASEHTCTWTTFGLALAIAAFTTLGLDYFVQIYTVQPALLANEAADVVALSQYNPHGLFIALEDFGYLAMALSLGAFAPALGGTRSGVAARWALGTAAILGVFALVAMSFVFGLGVEYRFEVAIITVDYFGLMIGGALVALSARRAAAPAQTRLAMGERT